MQDHQQIHRRNKSLPYRASSKHVVFSAVVRTNGKRVESTLPCNATATPLSEVRPQTQSNSEQRQLNTGSYIFDVVPTLVRTPWELERRPTKRWSWPSRASAERPRRQSRTPLLDRLPKNINILILDHVNNLHDSPAGVCVDCLLHDMYNFALVSKKWNEATSSYMYRTLWLPVCQQAPFLKRRDRLKLLLRTLQTRPDLARRVCRIHVACKNIDKQSENSKQNVMTDIASIVQMCPNLEALDGMFPECNSAREQSVLDAALVTRGYLKEYLWLLGQHGQTPKVLSPLHQNHASWKRLETLVIQERSPVLGPGNMYTILQQLPALQHLALIGLASSSFHDGTLQALVGLKSLRLESLQGLSDQGLAQSLPRLARSLRNLSLVDLDIKSLRTLSIILSNFSKLQRFTFAQDSPPGLPLGADVTLAVELPLLRSLSLVHMHWELLIPGSANDALETSVKSGGFPSLRSLRVPCDSDGIFQSLCRPVARRQVSEGETQRYRHEDAQAYTRDLAHARTAAQVRTRVSNHAPAVSVVIQEEGYVQYTNVMGRYLGNIQSKITYNLEADFEGTGQALARVDDIVDCETLACSVSSKKGKRHVVVRPRGLMSLF